MKVLALIEGQNEVCCRYRIEAFAWAMAQRRLQLEVEPLAGRTLPRIAQFRAAARADVVILQRKLLPFWQLALLRRRAKRLIYDVDDAVFQRDSYCGKPPYSRLRVGHFWATVYAADAVTAGNAFLARRAAAYRPAGQVHVVPTCVEPERYPVARHQRSGSDTRLVWIGQQSTLPSLDRLRPHLAAAAERLPGLAMRVICNRFPQIPGLRVLPCRWSARNEAASVAECDIGLNFLPDDTWSRGKCGLRVLQFMAAGLPVVANPVGMNREMVQHGRTGLLASTPEQWAAAIKLLADEPGLRAELGAAGRRLVEERFSTAVWGPRFARLVESVVVGDAVAGCPSRSDIPASAAVAYRGANQAVTLG